jgi:hypothetical protein
MIGLFAPNRNFTIFNNIFLIIHATGVGTEIIFDWQAGLGPADGDAKLD